MTDETHLELACQCKATVWQFSVPSSTLPQPHEFCACNACRHRTGTLAMFCFNLTEAPPAAIYEGLGSYTSYGEAGNSIKYFHCKTCGTKLLSEHNGGEDWKAMPSALNKAEGLYDFVGHEFIADTTDGGFAGFLPSIAGKKLPLYAKANPGALLDELPTPTEEGLKKVEEQNFMEMYCHCKATHLYVRRPQPELPLPRNCYYYRPPLTPEGLPTRYMSTICCCESCVRSSGIAYPGAAMVIIPFIDVFTDRELTTRWVDESVEPFTTTLTIAGTTAYRSSEDVSRLFCTTCAARLIYYSQDRPGIPCFAAGLVESRDGGSRNEKWLSWWVGMPGHPNPPLHRIEEALDQTVAKALEEGMVAWGEKVGQRPKAKAE